MSREFYSHRPKQVSDEQFTSEWDRIFGPARTPLPHSPMAEDAEGAVGEGATVPVLPADGQDHPSHGV
jgi:hypothetical protein